ncbi:hypothetical protein NDU88_006866 [Pleurodeles waltl]|uniref:Uncharacterized protein n=1 Tax=Pleurodeles waltl TaxID=8319 RepID=A0AAV7VR30_PLEWA|nr:hypothetical protein NDU88_006866 [Pleurodeles waltl]
MARTRSFLPHTSGPSLCPVVTPCGPGPPRPGRGSGPPPAASRVCCSDRFPLLSAVFSHAGAAPIRRSLVSLAAHRRGRHFVGRPRSAAQADQTSWSNYALCSVTAKYFGGPSA